jgi:hypothetical protein
MSQDGMPLAAASHPGRCDGHLQSESFVVPADGASDTVVELHLTSTFPGLKPSRVLMMELSMVDDDRPTRYLLTLAQARQLHDAVARLVGTERALKTPSLADPGQGEFCGMV